MSCPFCDRGLNFAATDGRCGKKHGGECGCDCHATDDVAGPALPVVSPAVQAELSKDPVYAALSGRLPGQVYDRAEVVLKVPAIPVLDDGLPDVSRMTIPELMHATGYARGPANVPTEIRNRIDLLKMFGSIHAAGTLGGFTDAIELLIEEQRPAGVTIEQIKRELAQYWLGRPRGVFARLRWAARLLLGP